jgi:nucleotide-binding universal stress UspA family protein
MFPIKKILGPTDFSEASRYGLRAAIEAAENLGAELIIVHVNVKPIILGTHVKSEVQSKVNMLMESLQPEVRQHLDKLIAELVPQKLCCNVRLVEGQPAEEITRLAKQEGADMIVMATHGHSGFNRFMSGSVAEKVVRMAHCPVLTVRPQEQK